MELHPDLQGKTVPLGTIIHVIYREDSIPLVNEILQTHDYVDFRETAKGDLWISKDGSLEVEETTGSGYGPRIIVRKRKVKKFIYTLADSSPREPAIGEFYSHDNDGRTIRERVFVSSLDGDYYIYTREVVEE